jgi:membrane protein
MTPENDAQRPAQDPGQQPDENKSALAAINDSTVAKKANQALKSVTGTAEKVQRNPIIAHLIRAAGESAYRRANGAGKSGAAG